MFQTWCRTAGDVGISSGRKRRPDVPQRCYQAVYVVWFVYVGGQYCRNVRQSEISEGGVDTVQFSKLSKNSEPSKWYSG